MVFYTSNIPRGTIDETGSFGIGTTNPNASSILDIVNDTKGVSFPQINLATTMTKPAGGNTPKDGTVVYNSNVNITGATANGKGMYYWDGGISGNWYFMKNVSDSDTVDWHVGGNKNGGLKTFGTNDSFDLPFVTNNSERMRLTTNGRLGIGTTSPSVGLHVKSADGANNDVIFEGIDDASTFSMYYTAASGLPTDKRLARINLGYTLGGTYYKGASIVSDYKGIANGVASESNLQFLTADNTRMTIDPNGNVGIGTTTPTTGLHLEKGKNLLVGQQITSGNFYQGTASTDGVYIENTNGNQNSIWVQRSSNSPNLWLTKNKSLSALSASSSYVSFVVGTTSGSPTTIGSITSNAAGTGVVYNATSDKRLKENVSPTHYGINDLIKIGVKDYNFITDESKTRETGFLAQDLYKIYPSAVTVGGNDATQNPWGIDYGKITPLLVKAIQDQQVEIENQKTQLLNKEGEIKSLQERLEKLEKAVNKLFK